MNEEMRPDEFPLGFDTDGWAAEKTCDPPSHFSVIELCSANPRGSSI